jgi:hypothetical protein
MATRVGGATEQRANRPRDLPKHHPRAGSKRCSELLWTPIEAEPSTTPWRCNPKPLNPMRRSNAVLTGLRPAVIGLIEACPRRSS